MCKRTDDDAEGADDEVIAASTLKDTAQVCAVSALSIRVMLPITVSSLREGPDYANKTIILSHYILWKE